MSEGDLFLTCNFCYNQRVRGDTDRAGDLWGPD